MVDNIFDPRLEVNQLFFARHAYLGLHGPLFLDFVLIVVLVDFDLDVIDEGLCQHVFIQIGLVLLFNQLPIDKLSQVL